MLDYKIRPGIPESELPAWLDEAAQRYGIFADGRIDYTNASLAPAVMCTLKSGDEILLAKRGQGLADANGYWSLINGFIDENRPVAEIAANEFKEETGLIINPADIKIAPSYTMESQHEKRAYIIFPCLAVIDGKPAIKLDREHTAYAWIKREELENYHILDDLPVVVDAALGLL